jgi:hypothetical protein
MVILALINTSRVYKGCAQQAHIPFDQMQAGGCLNDMADLPNLQAKSCILELLLHISLAKEATRK